MEHKLNVPPSKTQEIVNNFDVWLIEFFISNFLVVLCIVVGIVTVLAVE